MEVLLGLARADAHIQGVLYICVDPEGVIGRG
jgi:hypothetical protein